MYHFIYLKLPNKLPAYLANAGGCGLKCINMIYNWPGNSHARMPYCRFGKHGPSYYHVLPLYAYGNGGSPGLFSHSMNTGLVFGGLRALFLVDDFNIMSNQIPFIF